MNMGPGLPGVEQQVSVWPLVEVWSHGTISEPTAGPEKEH